LQISNQPGEEGFAIRPTLCQPLLGEGCRTGRIGVGEEATRARAVMSPVASWPTIRVR
jgi:hypothetical protein